MQFPIGFLNREQIRDLLNEEIASVPDASVRDKQLDVDDPRLTDAICAEFAIGYGRTVRECAEQYVVRNFVGDFVIDKNIDGRRRTDI